ncbi:lysine--tRNA ligase-like isoform 2 [Planoprotostelium fungivorum]|uniref:Lysine--tRNA ligase n=1 Tax=Planoprotostelium fungivorum TaxID=1890364 RepID=A0A2P6MWI2_9EUKA|nr:lysine--tRNA ligase-like isoform 2 [Planoprotostelium fungivorum]
MKGIHHLRAICLTKPKHFHHRFAIPQRLSSTEAVLVRKQQLNEYKEKTGTKFGLPLYDNRYKEDMSIAQFREKFDATIQNGQKLEDQIISIAGRISSKREASKKLFFYDLTRGDSQLQIMSTQQFYTDKDHYETLHSTMRRGDIVAVRGIPGKSKLGELSIIPLEVKILSPCIQPLPEADHLTHTDTRFMKRHLDLLTNRRSRDTLIARSKVITCVRDFFTSRGFIEMETPILGAKAGGANATPFVTQGQAIGDHLFLRIAPELYLKQLVIGGMEKVRRNEGVDATHNPEFTTCEFYQAYSDYNDIMDMTQELLRDIVGKVTGGSTITVEKNGTPHVIDFSKNFARFDLVTKLEETMNEKLPENFNSADCVTDLLEIAHRKGVYIPKPHTPARILDKLVGHFIEPLCIQPTFIMNHPLCLSPLAKSIPDRPQCTERFELFINEAEYCNAYSELNDPEEQRVRFRQQAEDKKLGDADSQVPDEEFCEALECALPPTGGFGLGVDRFVMLLTGSESIKEVIPFPIMKMHHSQKSPTQTEEGGKEK